MWYTRLEVNNHAHISLGELEMSQPKIMTVPKDETLVAFGTMNGTVYAIAKANKCDLYVTYIWSWGYIGSSIKKLYWWRPLVVTYTLDDALNL